MTRWLDRVTGKVTMYRLVLLCLLALAVEAILLSLTGAVAYSPLAIIVSGVVVVAVTWLSNRLLALLFRVQPHSESALITGMILFFIFLPLLDGMQLLGIALAGVLASASKYLLAIRGRHIFNPAAAGAFIESVILPANGPGWWIANPWLLPLVILAALLILFRTRHLTLGVIFVVVSAIALTLSLTANGLTFTTALTTAFVSFPIVYFGGFMLSEPLSLPPRRWQQIAVAVIVAILFAFPLHIGVFYGGYPLALMIGNLLAFLVGQRRSIRLEYLGRSQLSPTSWEFSFKPRRPVSFDAGQFMELTVPHRAADIRGLRRTFSIASAPSNPDVVSFGLRTAERSSSFKSTLLALKPGHTVMATAIGGDFVLPRDPATPLLFVAGGIGITPFVSQLSQLASTGEKRDIVLVYSSTSATDIAYLERVDFDGTRILLVAPERPTDLPDNWHYLGAGPVTADLLLAAVPDARSRHAYVSGPPALVHDLKPALRRAGIRRVKTDYFSGY